MAIQRKKYLVWRAELWSSYLGEGGRKFYLTDWPEEQALLDKQTEKIERLATQWAKGQKGYHRDKLGIEKWAEAELVEIRDNPAGGSKGVE